MYLPMVENVDLSDRQIAYEIGSAYKNVEMGYEAITTGNYDDLSSEEDKNLADKVMNSKGGANKLFRQIIKLRDYGYFGQLSSDLENPHDLYALILMGAPAAELYNGHHAYGSSAILQAVVARSKIDQTLNIHQVEVLQRLEPCQGFSVGDHFNGLTLYELALLSRMSVQAVKNDLRKPGSPKTRYETKAEDSEEDQAGNPKLPNLVTVDVREAYDWLKGRRGFIDTYAIDSGLSSSEVTYLVPQAKDQSVFSGDCRLGKGFKIGKKGEEEYVESFQEALIKLRAMPKAYWRRPSSTSGISGIVSGATWVHKTADELNLDQ